MKKVNVLFLVVIIFSLTACAQWNVKKCSGTSWYEEGKRVGSETKPMNAMYSAQAECRRLGVAVDMRAYEMGWKEGLRQTCNAQRGYELGASGANRASFNCPAPFDKDFYQAFDQGIRKYCSSPKLAFAKGRAGEPMPNCPGDLQAGFAADYQRGLALHEQVQALQNRIDELNRRAEDIQNKMREEDQKKGTNYDLMRRYQREYDRLQNEILNLRQQMTVLKVI